MYNHNGYLFKLPVILSDDGENTSAIGLSLGLTVAANAAVYFGYRALKNRKTKLRNRELKVAYAKYQSRNERVQEYVREQQIFY